MAGKSKLLKSKEERRAEKQVRKLRSTNRQEVARNVELILESHQEKSGRTKVGYGPLFRQRVSDEIKEKHNIPKDKDVALYEHGEKNPVWFLAPARITAPGNAISFAQTIKGMQRILIIVIIIVFLDHYWLISTLPNSHYMTFNEMFFNPTAKVIYTAIFCIGILGWWFRRESQAFRIKIRCLEPHTCDKGDLHWGCILNDEMSDGEQWAFWKDLKEPFPKVSECLKEGIMEEIKIYRDKAEIAEIRANLTEMVAEAKIYERLMQQDIMMADDPRVKYMKGSLAASVVVIFVLLTILIMAATGGG